MSVRAERAAEALRLRETGMLQREIAERLGVSRSYAQQLLDDPDGFKLAARKDTYRGTCENCGSLTDGSNGHANAPRLCAPCTHQKQHYERYWTQQRILEQIAAFVSRYGRKPLSSEWLRAKPADPDEPWVETSIVLREFGTWNDAMRAAGLPADDVGKFKRSAKTRVRMSKASRVSLARRHDHARDYGELAMTTVSLGSDQFDALRSMNGVGVSEHVRRAVDLYLAQVSA